MATSALLLASCGSSGPSSLTTAGGSGATGSSGPGSSSSNQLSALGDQLKASKNATFKATWTTTSGSSTSTVTLEQRPPKSLFASGGSTMISTGSQTYICSGPGSGASETCLLESGSNSLAGIEDIYTGQTFLSALSGWENEVAAKILGVDVSFSNRTFAGVPSKCVQVSANGQSQEWCVGGSGILTYSKGSGDTFELTSYSTSAPASDFALPAGATIETIPGASGQ
jgi:hypothetical protein